MGLLTCCEDDWQQQLDELVALASILDKDFTLTRGPEVTGDLEQDISALALASPRSEQLQCSAAVRVVLPAGGIVIKVCLQSCVGNVTQNELHVAVLHLRLELQLLLVLMRL